MDVIGAGDMGGRVHVIVPSVADSVQPVAWGAAVRIGQESRSVAVYLPGVASRAAPHHDLEFAETWGSSRGHRDPGIEASSARFLEGWTPVRRGGAGPLT